MPLYDYDKTYSLKSDEELQEIASDLWKLTEDAVPALKAELQKRKICPCDFDAEVVRERRHTRVSASDVKWSRVNYIGSILITVIIVSAIKYTVRHSNVLPVSSRTTESVAREFLKEPVYRSIKQYYPEIWKNLVAETSRQVEKGASETQIMQAGAPYIVQIMEVALPRTSDAALIQFATTFVAALRTASLEHPAACLTVLFPERFGHLHSTTILTGEHLTAAMNSVVVDAQVNPNLHLNKTLTYSSLTKLSEPLWQLEQHLLQEGSLSFQDSKKACNAAIAVCETILAMETTEAANALRYIFSQPS